MSAHRAVLGEQAVGRVKKERDRSVGETERGDRNYIRWVEEDGTSKPQSMSLVVAIVSRV
jgi:hypothetical protein